MKILSAAPAFLAALLACGCASSAWETTESVPGGRLYVPKLYAPLLPGSIYPDKKMPVPAKGRPALVVVCPERGDCRKDEILEQAARRGMVVLVFTRPPFAPPKDDLLRTRPEANAERTGWLLVSPTDDFLRKWMGAGATPCVLLFPSSPSKQIPNAVSRRVLLAALNGSEANLSSEGVIEKLYAPDAAGRLPREAYRDAVEWLVGELGAR